MKITNINLASGTYLLAKSPTLDLSLLKEQGETDAQTINRFICESGERMRREIAFLDKLKAFKKALP